MGKRKSFREMAGADDLTNRTEESYNTRESSGKYNDYFTDDMPLTKFICNKGPHILDVVPFIAGKNHPNVAEGKATHNVDVFVHFGIGITESSYLCPGRMNRGDCPICEYQAELKKRKNYDEDFVKSFNAKRRVVYNVLVYDTLKDEDAGVMLWEASHHLSEKNIMAIARNNRTGAFVKWADPDEGKTIEFSREGSGALTRYVGFKFTDRGKGEEISDDILDDAIQIGDYLHFLTYDELKKVLGPIDFKDEEPLSNTNTETYEEVETRTPRNSGRSRSRRGEGDSGRTDVDKTETDKESEKKPEEDTGRSRRSRRTQNNGTDDKESEKTETGTTLARRRPRRN